MTTAKNPDTTPWFPPENPPRWQGWYDFRPASLAGIVDLEPLPTQRRWYGLINGKLGWSLAVRDHHTAQDAEARRAMSASAESLEDCVWRGRVTPAPHYSYDLPLPAVRREVE